MSANDLPVLLWFQDNLRLYDNAALSSAVATRKPIIPIVLDDNSYNENARKWLQISLEVLSDNIHQKKGKLFYLKTNDILMTNSN